MAQNMSSLALTSLPHWTAFSQSASLYLVGGMVMYSCHLVTSGILVRPGPCAGWDETAPGGQVWVMPHPSV